MNGLPDRFWAKVDKTDDGCWEWTAGKSKGGYGMFWVDGKFHYGHRLSWEDVNGPIPDGLVIDHLCRNRACVRPDHLRVVTSQDNTLAEGSLSLAKLHADKTHCDRGHPFTVENTYHRPDRLSGRVCRACDRDRKRAAVRDDGQYLIEVSS